IGLRFLFQRAAPAVVGDRRNARATLCPTRCVVAIDQALRIRGSREFGAGRGSAAGRPAPKGGPLPGPRSATPPSSHRRRRAPNAAIVSPPSAGPHVEATA